MTYEAHIARLWSASSAAAGSAAATAGGSDRDSSGPGTAATPREIILNSRWAASGELGDWAPDADWYPPWHRLAEALLSESKPFGI